MPTGREKIKIKMAQPGLTVEPTAVTSSYAPVHGLGPFSSLFWHRLLFLAVLQVEALKPPPLSLSFPLSLSLLSPTLVANVCANPSEAGRAPDHHAPAASGRGEQATQ